MIELPIYLMPLYRQPIYVVVFTAVVPVIFLLVCGTLMRIPPFKWIAAVCAGAVGISWPIGFALAIIMLLCGVDGVHLLLCWLILLMGCFTFVVCHHRRLAGIVQEYNSNDDNKAVISSGPRRGGRPR